MTPMPGLLSEISGSDVKEFTFVGYADENVMMDWNGNMLETGIFNDILEPVGTHANVLAKYAGNYYKGSPVLIENTYGEGKVLHFGGTFTRENVKAFLDYTGVVETYRDVVEVPEECEITVKEKNHKMYIFVLNYSDQKQEIWMKKPAKDMDTKSRQKDKFFWMLMRQKFMKFCNSSGVLPITGALRFVFVISFIFFAILSYFWPKSTNKIKDFHALSLYHEK